MSSDLDTARDSPPELGLTPDELKRWEEHGYLGPYTAWTPDQAERLRRPILSIYRQQSLAYGFHTSRDRHLDSRSVFDAGTHPAMISRCESLLGPDLLLWRSQFFNKAPGTGDVMYHQERDSPGRNAYVPAIEPPENVSCWLGLTKATKANGCVKLLPGSHHRWYDMRPVTSGPGLFDRGVELAGIDDFDPVYMQLEAGQFFMFNESMVHGSDVNRTDSERTAIVFRFAPTSSRIYRGLKVDASGMPVKRWRAILVHGEDRFGNNRLGPPPRGEEVPGSARRLVGKLRRRYYRRFHGMYYS